MSKPIITVIVGLQGNGTLDRCGERSLSADCGRVACILVDDGSPVTAVSCDTWAGCPRDGYPSGGYGGICCAQQRFFPRPTVEFIVFLDSDDALRPGAPPWLGVSQNMHRSPSCSGIIRRPRDTLTVALLMIQETAHRSHSCAPRLDLCLLAMPWEQLYRTELAPAALQFDNQYTFGRGFTICYWTILPPCLAQTAGFTYTVMTATLTFYDCSRGGTLSTKVSRRLCKSGRSIYAKLLTRPTTLCIPCPGRMICVSLHRLPRLTVFC